VKLIDAVLVFRDGKRLYLRVPPREHFVLACYPGPNRIFVRHGATSDGPVEYVEGDRRSEQRLRIRPN
jgi:hypothetical protein